MSGAAPSIGQVLGHYRILEQVGAGGMGVVFRAHDEQLDRDVALKTLPGLGLLSEAARRQFRREALSLAKITDSHVAMAFDFGRDNGIDYLITEYVPGVTLNTKIAGRPLPESEVLNLGRQLASGLEAAHREGVIHRDLKPGNLKVTPDGKLKILDFGLAFLLQSSEAETAVTAPTTGSYADAGTLPYMAPEQLKGGICDARSDLWAAGMVLYEMSTGKHPFGDLTGAQLIAAILEREPVAPRALNPKISEVLQRIIVRATQKDPQERYQSAGDLRIDLAGLATGTMPHVYPKPEAKAKWWRWAAGAALVIVLAGVGRWWTHRGSALQVSGAEMMAVLPFESTGNDASTNALGLGLTETVTAKLVQATDGGQLQFVSTRDLVAQGVKTADQARREFGTDLVLEGSLQQSGDRIRITWSLVDSRTHTQRAADTITGDADDIFAMQDSLFEEVIEKLPLAIDSGWRGAIEGRPEKPAAYDFYLRGRGYLEDYQSADHLNNAIAQFERAIAVDRNYAPAYAAMGMAYNSGFQLENRGKDWVEKAKEQCEHALAITPQLAEGHTCLGNVDVSTGHYEEAVQQFRRSLDLDHTSDETLRFLAAAYQKLGKTSAAEDAYRQAISVRPNYWGVYAAFGVFYYKQARYLDAVAMFQKAIQLAPLNYSGYSNLGGIYLLLGQYEDAVQALRQSTALRPTSEAYGNLGAAYFYMRRYQDSADSLQQALKIDEKDWLNWGNLGDALYQIPARRTEALEAYRKAADLARARLEVNPRDAVALAFTADYYAMLDQERHAREQMARALEITSTDADVLFRAAILHNHFGETEQTLAYLRRALAAGYSNTVIRDTPDFDHLKDDPHFRALLPQS